MLLTIVGAIYLTGWHTEVIGRVQQVVLSTGIISPTILTEEKKASYDFWLEDKNGKQIPFNQMKGEIVFLNFWATWCPPCIAEMPDIQNLYNKKEKSIQFVMVSLDENEQKARSFIEKKGFDFPVYFLRSRLPSVYDTHSIPTTYVVDSKGIIRVENHGMAKYNTEKFKNLLKELEAAQEAFK